MELILAFLAFLGLVAGQRSAPPPPVPPPAVRAALPAKAPQRADQPARPPTPLPPAQGCIEARWTGDPLTLPGRVDGKAIKGVSGLTALRAAWGDALIVVEGGDFSGMSFAGLRLRNVCFRDSNFANSDWRGARTRGVGFIWANLSGARLDRSRMRGLLLNTVRLDGASAVGADWRGGLLRGGPMGSLERVRLDGADLRGFRADCGGGLEGRCLTSWGEISLRGADLRSARLDTLYADLDWTGARLADTTVNLYQLAEMKRARRVGPLIVRSGEVELRLSPAEYRALQPFIESHREPRTEPVAAKPSKLRPGTTSLFVQIPVRFAPAFRATALYRRLVPLLAADPIARVLVTVRSDGRIDAQGDGLSGAGHLCDLYGKGLRRDRSTGWYSGPHKPDATDPPEWRNRSMPVLRFRGDWAEAYMERRSDPRDTRISDYVSCGARASFGEMIRLPLTAAEARRWSRAELR
jgi:uncharacterized protein YjbI with pentapeptide repeats